MKRSLTLPGMMLLTACGLFLTACGLFLTACAVGPKYQRPGLSVPSAYKEDGAWQPARPAELGRTAWWRIYNDPVLDALEQQVAVSNQTLKADAAAYRQAEYAVATAQAGFFPTVSSSASGTRARARAASAADTANLSADASWAPDIWGRIRDTVAEQRANAGASKADLAAATLSAQGALAVDYFQLRGTDELERLLRRTVAADADTLRIVTNQYKAGASAKADVLQAQAQLDAARSQLAGAGVQRRQLEHALAVLAGRAPAGFSLAPQGDIPPAPDVPAGVPAALLQRRPDIAAAERRAAAANAAIGV
ncbi:MAG: efflux transporter outer membrane subunit, partial [Alphaproteobacteria bacterium]|nr:efflux transporter outer membrane subunit [Alphaproteobacteria bacterium]